MREMSVEQLWEELEAAKRCIAGLQADLHNATLYGERLKAALTSSSVFWRIAQQADKIGEHWLTPEGKKSASALLRLFAAYVIRVLRDEIENAQNDI